MNYYPPSYINAAAAAAVAASTSSLTSSDIERFQYLTQSPYFMQNNNILANMFRMFPKLANNMSFSNLILKQNLASLSTASANNYQHELSPSLFDQTPFNSFQPISSIDSNENSMKSKNYLKFGEFFSK